MIGWRAWYTEGREFDGATTDWSDLPPSGVLFVVEYRETGRTMWSGLDWYVYHGGAFSGVSSGEWGTWQERPTGVCSSCVKQGVGVTDEEFERVSRLAWEA